MTIKRLRGDMTVVRIESPASEPDSGRIIIAHDIFQSTKEKTAVYWGELLMAGDGLLDKHGVRIPSILDCPGFEIGVKVLCLQRFSHAGAQRHVAKDEVMIHDFDILAAIDTEGRLRPAWGRCLIDAPRPTREPRLAPNAKIILIVEEGTDYREEPLRTGVIKATSADLDYRGSEEEAAIKNRVWEFFGVREPSFKTDDTVIFERFNAWRVFADDSSRDDNLMLVPQKDVLSIIDDEARFQCVRVTGERSAY